MSFICFFMSNNPFHSLFTLVLQIHNFRIIRVNDFFHWSLRKKNIDFHQKEKTHISNEFQNFKNFKKSFIFIFYFIFKKHLVKNDNGFSPHFSLSIYI